MTPTVTQTYNYSASKVDGRFSVSVSCGGVSIGSGEGFRTVRGVKGFAKACALAHRNTTRTPDSHSESHSLYGTLSV